MFLPTFQTWKAAEMETQVEGTELGGYPQSTEAAAGSSERAVLGKRNPNV